MSRRSWILSGCAALLGIAAVAGLAWLAPAYLAESSLRAETERYGIDVRLGGVRPIWPLGFHADTADVKGPDAALQLTDVDTVWGGGSTLRSTARLGTGTLELHASLRGGPGQLFARGVPIEALQLLKKQGIALRGQITGVIAWERDLRFSARMRGGTVSWLGGILGARTDHLSVIGEWVSADRVANLEQIEAFGPSFDLTGSGQIDSEGDLELQLEVQRVEDRLVRALRVLGISPPPAFPAHYALVGPYNRARLELQP